MLVVEDQEGVEHPVTREQRVLSAEEQEGIQAGREVAMADLADLEQRVVAAVHQEEHQAEPATPQQ